MKESLSRMEMRKVFPTEPFSNVNSLDFYRDGEFLLASCDDGTVQIFNALDGKELKTLYSKSNGAANSLFTHHSSGIICSSNLNKFNHSVQYISVHDDAIIREFRGHSDRINALALSPSSDLFISASLDSDVRIWDLSSPQCTGLLPCPDGHHIVAIDPEAYVFTTLSTGNVGRFFDLRKYSSGPFTTFTVDHEAVTWAAMDFSNDGKLLLASTHQGVSFLLDALTGKLLFKFVIENKTKCRVGGTITPDSQFALIGTENKHIHVFSLTALKESAVEEDSKEIVVLKGHSGPVGCVRFNPEYNMFASTCTVTALWQPAE